MKSSMSRRLLSSLLIPCAFFLVVILSIDANAGRSFRVPARGAEPHTTTEQTKTDIEFERTHEGRSKSQDALYQSRLSDIKHSILTNYPLRKHELIGDGLDGIYVRLPAEDLSHHDKFVINTAKQELKRLNEPLDLKSLYILNVANDVGSKGMFTANIPDAIRRRSASIKSAFDDSSSSAGDLFEKIREISAGSTLIIIGHIDENYGTLNIERPGISGSISILRLQQEAVSAHINLIILGCNSSSAAAIGTTQPIDSVQVIQELGSFLNSRQSHASTTRAQLYVATAKAVGGLLVDPFTFKVMGLTSLIGADGQITGSTFSHFSYGPCKLAEVPPNSVLNNQIRQLLQQPELRSRPRCLP